MKSLLTICLVVLLAGTAVAQAPNCMGLFFSDVNFTNETTNVDLGSGLSDAAYIVLLNPTVDSIAAYEVGIDIAGLGSQLFVTSVNGPNGWTNFGGPTNHLCGYQEPLLLDGGTVLATVNILSLTSETVNFVFGPSDPSSVDDAGPALADGDDPTNLITCTYTSCPELGGLVATINGDGIELCDVVATESQSWTAVKALF
jgi:hypothetical protein